MGSIANADQETFWSDTAGRRWVSYQTDMDALLAPVLDLVLDSAALGPGERVLDIGCGTGHSTEQAAQAVGAQGRVTGLDISDTMLDLARTRLAAHPQTDLLLADAQTHRFEGHSFDVLMSRFGVMFFDDTIAAFANLWRSLAPGGRMVLAAWGPAPENPFFMAPAKVARAVLGPMPKSDRTQPGPFAFEEPDRILPQLSAAGVTDPQARTCQIDLTPRGTARDLARLCCEIGPADSALRHHAASNAQRTALEDALAEDMRRFETASGLRVPACIHLYSARKSA